MSYPQEASDYSRTSRKKSSTIKLWWLSLDRFSIGIILIISAFSLIMITTASPAVAYRIGIDPLYFMKRQIIHVALGICIMIVISSMSINTVRRLAIIGFFVSVIALILVLLVGYETKGSKRWINILGFSLQPSEFTKTFFALFTAWILSIKYDEQKFPAFKISLASYLLVTTLVLMQPDLGMTISMSVVWIGQLFIAGLSLIWFFSLLIFGLVSMICAYIFLPHVKNRLDSFLNPENFENYQIKKSIEAFNHGGFYGVGPGEGTVKQYIPDSHADFIFSVIGEEMGFIVCALLLFLFALLIIRGLYIITFESNNFSILAVSGILLQIGLQSMFNMGMTLHLLPTKGVTLPLVSYGGSSALSTFIALGIILAFTRRRYNIITLPTRNFRIDVQ